jgi:hypothetical protein
MMRFVFAAAMVYSMATASFAAGTAAPPSTAADFSPMSFLVGSCWVGPLGGGAVTDEHCFEWLYKEHFIRDHHVVRDKSGATVYEGETLYSWNPLAKQIEFRYWSAEGLVVDGTVSRSGDSLVMPSHYASAEGMHELRTTWTRVGDDAYSATGAEKAGDQWKTQLSTEYRRKK